ncbi:homoserine kinase [Acetobacteraceae bacterium]|nr:homoserine kinase [Acetobacteraceae bacterium]
MAVYTSVTSQQAADFLKNYALGDVCSLEPISEGVENSNFFLNTTQGRFILTLVESRTDPKDLPWLAGLVNYLWKNNFPVPKIIASQQGRLIGSLQERPALISKFLEGQNNPTPITPEICEILGREMGKFHLLGQQIKEERSNPLGSHTWHKLLKEISQTLKKKEGTLFSLYQRTEKALTEILRDWPVENLLPRGQIHADLFPDNVLFLAETDSVKISGIIDFYFACTDFLLWDLAILLNAWCFGADENPIFQPALAEALLKGYQSERLLREEEKKVLPLFCQGAAMRFLLTRFYDWINTPTEALVKPKDPFAYEKRRLFFSQNNPFEMFFRS